MNNHIENQIVEIIDSFADEKFQIRSWFGIGPEVSSPVEMCNWLDDIGFEAWAKSLGEEHSLLSESCLIFLAKVNSIDERGGPTNAFVSDEWRAIRVHARLLVELIRNFRNV